MEAVNGVTRELRIDKGKGRQETVKVDIPPGMMLPPVVLSMQPSQLQSHCTTSTLTPLSPPSSRQALVKPQL